jgi:hypothetical protein
MRTGLPRNIRRSADVLNGLVPDTGDVHIVIWVEGRSPPSGAVELGEGPDGAADESEPQALPLPFSGWLELLRVLEELLGTGGRGF